MVGEDNALAASQYQVTTILLDNSTYYWHVRIKNVDGIWCDWSSTWNFAVDILPPSTPSPASGSIIQHSTPRLDWEDVAEASGYRVQVNTNASFTGTIVADDSTLSVSHYIVPTILSDNTTYYWRVKLRNSDGVWSDWSSTWNFTVDILPPVTLYPPSGSIIQDTTPYLDWEDVTDAAGYRIQVNTNGSFTGIMAADNSALSASQYLVATILSDHTTYYWHVKVKNSDGVWGDWSSTWSFGIDVDVPTAAKVFGGGDSSFALKNDGTLWASGHNVSGQLGTGDTTMRLHFTQVLTGVSAVAAVSSHTMALKNDGTLWACGRNENGQLGTGDTTNRINFTQVLTGVSAAATGSDHTMALKNDGTLWACGANGYGELGTGDTTKRLSFTQVLTGVCAIAVGRDYSLAIKTDGTLWACGHNAVGQLGTGDNINRSTFTQVLTGVSVAAASDDHSLAMKSNGTLWACGRNEHGQLGTGDTIDRNSFIQVITGISAIAVGCEHSMALKSNGTLWACGWNWYGELGTGNTTDRHSFTQVLDGVSACSAGDIHTLVLKNDSTLWGCGTSEFGQLGTWDTKFQQTTFIQMFLY